MKSALRQVRMADLISSEDEGGRFHPSSLGFHPAKQDFIKDTRLRLDLFAKVWYNVLGGSDYIMFSFLKKKKKTPIFEIDSPKISLTPNWKNIFKKGLTFIKTYAIISTVLREWRNWQTRTFEGRVVLPYGFNSRLPHQKKTVILIQNCSLF